MRNEIPVQTVLNKGNFCLPRGVLL